MNRLIFALAIFTCISCEKEHQTQVTPPPVVSVMALKLENLVPSLEFTGRAEASNNIELRSRITGFLLKDNTKAGSFFKKGDLLFQIERNQFESALKQEEGTLLVVTANLKNSELELKRQENLYTKGAASKEAYENALYKKIEAQGRLKVQEAVVEKAHLDLSYTQIYAPADGRMGYVQSNVGNVVTPSTDLGNLMEINPIKIRFNLPSTDLLSPQFSRAENIDAKLLKSLRIQAIFQNGTLYGQEGTIVDFDNKIEFTTGTLRINSEFPNPGHLILPGMFMKVKISMREGITCLAIPTRAIRQAQAGAQIFILNADNTVELRYVVLGVVDGSLVEIKEGAVAGERVIVEGISKVRPGEKAITIEQLQQAQASKE